MMTSTIQPLEKVSEVARNALIQALGISDTMRFLSQFRSGAGDYTEQKSALFDGETVQSLAARIRAERSISGSR